MPCVGASLRMEGSIDLVVSTPTVIDEIPTDEYGCVIWHVLATRYTGSGQSDRILYVVSAAHNGSPTADATNGGSEYNVSIEAQAGASSASQDITISVDLNGTGVSQKARLIAEADTADWSVTRTRAMIVGIAP